MTSTDLFKMYLKRPPKPFNSILENGDKMDYFTGVNVEKPESLTPLEMELRIQADRVVYALKKTISVMHVMAHIPMLLENDAKILRQYFTKQEMNYVMWVLSKYDETSGANVDVSTLGELYDVINRTRVARMMNKNPELAPDANLAQVLFFIYMNSCVREEIKKAHKPTTIPFLMKFCRNMQELLVVAKLKLYVTGSEEEARDKQLRQAYKSSVMLSAAIKDLEQQLEIQREQLGNELNQKVATFEKYNSKISGVKEEFQISIEKIIHESEKRMMHQCLESEERQATLSVEAEEATKQVKALLKSHLEEEKQLRTKRNRVETQLQNWLTKYDQDIGDKQIEYETLKAKYDEERAAMDDLEEKMDEQEREYNTLMAEKQEEEERVYMEMAWQLLINRSARIIQRAWRAYRERRSKRRGKKGKKGKDGKPKLRITKKDDPNAVLESKFKGDVFEEMKNPNAF